MTTTTTFDALAVPKPTTPRGARVAAELFTRAAGWLRARPPVLTRGEEAAAVREMAYRLQSTDPNFAADLFAAAARHESLDD